MCGGGGGYVYAHGRGVWVCVCMGVCMCVCMDLWVIVGVSGYLCESVCECMFACANSRSPISMSIFD